MEQLVFLWWELDYFTPCLTVNVLQDYTGHGGHLGGHLGFIGKLQGYTSTPPWFLIRTIISIKKCNKMVSQKFSGVPWSGHRTRITHSLERCVGYLISTPYPQTNVSWGNVGPTSGRQYRRWDNVGPTHIAVWVWLLWLSPWCTIVFLILERVILIQHYRFFLTPYTVSVIRSQMFPISLLITRGFYHLNHHWDASTDK